MRISDWSSDVCSSDLPREIGALHFLVGKRLPVGHGRFVGHLHFVPPRRRGSRVTNVSLCDSRLLPSRSEEHTTELQSLMRISYAVFCLKKKKKTKYHISLDQYIPNQTDILIKYTR